jgi:hypothetical protein
MTCLDIDEYLKDPALSWQRQVEFVTGQYRLGRLDVDTYRRQLQRLGYHGARLNAEIEFNRTVLNGGKT